MKEYYLKTEELRSYCGILRAGDKVYLSGTVYTARDAAHKRIFELLSEGAPLPFSLSDAVIYYAGPTPTPDNLPIGSCGPTTSSRMDPYTAKLYDLGVCATIGKGERNQAVIDSIVGNNAIYFSAIGGAGALYSACVDKSEVIAFSDLGCESIKKISIKDFPLYVAVDSNGNTIYNK